MVLCWNFLNSKSFVNTWCDIKNWFSFFCHNNNNVDDDKLDKALYSPIRCDVITILSWVKTLEFSGGMGAERNIFG